MAQVPAPKAPDCAERARIHDIENNTWGKTTYYANKAIYNTNAIRPTRPRPRQQPSRQQPWTSPTSASWPFGGCRKSWRELLFLLSFFVYRFFLLLLLLLLLLLVSRPVVTCGFLGCLGFVLKQNMYLACTRCPFIRNVCFT